MYGNHCGRSDPGAAFSIVAAEKLTPKGSPSGTDIITHINGQRVRTVAEMNEVLKGVQPGEVVSLRTYTITPDGTGVGRTVRIRTSTN